MNKLQSRLGFLMLTAGCAVGLGNVWRFPFIVGKNGGAAFVLVYLVFLIILGFPLLTAELALGRGSGSGLEGAYKRLASSHSRFWGIVGTVIFSGNVLLMIYYTSVAGWLESFMVSYLTSGSARDFSALVASTPTSSLYMFSVVSLATLICALGLNRGVERITKAMMISLLVLISIIAVKALSLPGAMKGVEFYLKPDFAPLLASPISFCFDAMAQAFFTLSVGVGAMTIFGSYIDKRYSLAKEASLIVLIDTFVAFISGLVIFPVCAAYQVDVKAGPGLIFEALPKVFSSMKGGGFWGFVFFLFLSLAALTTVVAVFECIIAGFMKLMKLSRMKAVLLTGVTVTILSLPCVLFNGVLEVEDFVFSQLWLPFGGLSMCLFVSLKSGWAYDEFAAEVSSGDGFGFPRFFRYLFRYAIPALIALIVIGGVS